jgi:hypothetical protein
MGLFCENHSELLVGGIAYLCQNGQHWSSSIEQEIDSKIKPFTGTIDQ